MCKLSVSMHLEPQHPHKWLSMLISSGFKWDSTSIYGFKLNQGRHAASISGIHTHANTHTTYTQIQTYIHIHKHNTKSAKILLYQYINKKTYMIISINSEEKS